RRGAVPGFPAARGCIFRGSALVLPGAVPVPGVVPVRGGRMSRPGRRRRIPGRRIVGSRRTSRGVLVPGRRFPGPQVAGAEVTELELTGPGFPDLSLTGVRRSTGGWLVRPAGRRPGVAVSRGTVIGLAGGADCGAGSGLAA